MLLTLIIITINEVALSSEPPQTVIPSGVKQMADFYNVIAAGEFKHHAK